MSRVILTIDGQKLEVPEGVTIFQAARIGNLEIPHFCYHPRLKIAGNCRMCLVEVENQNKLAASCAMPVTEGMVVHTQSDKVKKAREGVLEFLLINHPLDCPICDQGGECDLQDLTLNYGNDRGRFRENKRSVQPKYMGPVIKTFMNRCIHCTRCVRFSEDIAGLSEIGSLHRGENMEIATYLRAAVRSELSGNLVDICPVGALTSRPYSFRGRPWELRHTESIDIMDAVGSHIRVDSTADTIQRILPRMCEAINEDWISDKSRYSFEGISYQRLEKPLLRTATSFEAISWEQALVIAQERLSRKNPLKKAAIVGDLIDVEAMFALRKLWNVIGSPHIDCRQNNSLVSTEHRSHYLFNSGITGIDKADTILIVGGSLRFDATLIHARIRKACIERQVPVFSVGESQQNWEFLFPFTSLGNDKESLERLLTQDNKVTSTLKKAKFPLLILMDEVLCHERGHYIQGLCHQIVDQLGFMKRDPKEALTWNGFNVVSQAASRVGGLDMGIVPGKEGMPTKEIIAAAENGAINTLLLMGADEITVQPHQNCFVIYMGHHGDRGAEIADLILPTPTYLEKEGTYVNLEGRVQRAHQVIPAFGSSKPEWEILKRLQGMITDVALEINLEVLREEIYQEYAVYQNIGKRIIEDFQPLSLKKSNENYCVDNLPSQQQSYYLTNPIARNSKTMRSCYRILECSEQGIYHDSV